MAGAKKPPRDIYELRVTLEEVEPRVWRTLQVRAADTLHRLHLAIQGAFGWQDYHLYAFRAHGREYGDPRTADGDPVVDARKVKLRQVVGRGELLAYEYDFGDDWQHAVRVVAALPKEPGVPYPRCIDGARACPPEDVGGPDGYAGMLRALADPDPDPDADDAEDEAAAFRRWAPKGFDPEAFSVEAANERIRARLRRR